MVRVASLGSPGLVVRMEKGQVPMSAAICRARRRSHSYQRALAAMPIYGVNSESSKFATISNYASNATDAVYFEAFLF